MGFVASAVKAVAKAVGSVVKAVVSNPLQVIETVALTAIAGPAGAAISEATGATTAAVGSTAFWSGAATTGITEATATMLVNSVGRAAIAAANGGSMASIVGGDIAPILSNPSIQQSILGTSVNSAISPVVNNIIKDPTIANIITGAVGNATVSGAVAGITGQNVMDAALGAGLGSAVAQTVNKLWTNIKQAPQATQLTTDYANKYQQYQNLGAAPILDKANILQNDVNSVVPNVNSALDDYNASKAKLDDTMNLYNSAKNANNVDLANSYADQINNTLTPQTDALAQKVNDFYSDYQSKLDALNNYTTANKDVIDQGTSLVKDMTSLQQHYDVFNDQTLAEYNQVELAKAIRDGDYSKAADIQAHITDLNNNIIQNDPNASISQSILTDPSEINLLNKIQNAPDDATRQQLISQAKLNPYFQDLASNPAYNVPTPQVTTPTNTTGTGTTTGTTTTPTTTPTTPATTTDVSKLSPVTNALQNLIKGAISSGITNQITGGGTTPSTNPTTPSTTIPKPAQHVDISTLKPFTGTMPANLATSQNTGKTTTPTSGLGTQTITPTTTTTGGLTSTTQPQNIVANTTTQTPISGLQSIEQPQTVDASQTQQKADINNLTPVTDTNLLKSLGLNIG